MGGWWDFGSGVGVEGCGGGDALDVIAVFGMGVSVPDSLFAQVEFGGEEAVVVVWVEGVAGVEVDHVDDGGAGADADAEVGGGGDEVV